MARKTVRPGRTLAIFFLVLAIAFGLVAVGGAWKPELGLDLQGGTEISMTAKNPQGGSIRKESLDEARSIIDQRVNGTGVTGAKVTTEGGDIIKVSIPGAGAAQKQLAERVRQTAKLNFRLVACESTKGCGGASQSTGSAPGSMLQQAPTTGTGGGVGGTGGTGTSPRAPFADSSPSPSPSPTSNTVSPTKTVPVDDATKFMRNVPQEWVTKFNSFTCPGPGAPPVQDLPGKPLLTCDSKGQTKYLLSPAIIEGTQIKSASYGIPQNGASYAVMLDFKHDGNSAFADATGAIAGTQELFAITLDAKVISAATAESRISGGAQITGNFTQRSAAALSNNLKYGSLPLDFPEAGIQTQNIGPSLAGNQLSAGLWAGALGLLLVMVFCLLYYRGLGIVVVGSLIVAGASTYAMILLLSKTAGVTVDLPGIAGIIVAVGITADSFIVYFERIRDEMREGRSMRVAVDNAWSRARNTCLAADTVSILAAVTLYIFASNEVRGFAFMLGLSTLIDLVVFFFFTHPMVKLLSTRRFFNRGHRLSGLDAEALGVDKIALGGVQ